MEITEDTKTLAVELTANEEDIQLTFKACLQQNIKVPRGAGYFNLPDDYPPGSTRFPNPKKPTTYKFIGPRVNFSNTVDKYFKDVEYVQLICGNEVALYGPLCLRIYQYIVEYARADIYADMLANGGESPEELLSSMQRYHPRKLAAITNVDIAFVTIPTLDGPAQQFYIAKNSKAFNILQRIGASIYEFKEFLGLRYTEEYGDRDEKLEKISYQKSCIKDIEEGIKDARKELVIAREELTKLMAMDINIKQ